MLEDTATTEEDQSTKEVETEETFSPTHPYEICLLYTTPSPRDRG